MPDGSGVVEGVEGVEGYMRGWRVDAVLGDPHAIRPVDAKSCGVQRVSDGRRQCGVGDDLRRCLGVVLVVDLCGNQNFTARLC